MREYRPTFRKRKRPKESYFRSKFNGYCKQRGIDFLSLTGKNYPDGLYMFGNGRISFVEFKREMNGTYGLTTGQKGRIDKLTNKGYDVMVVSPDMNWEDEIERRKDVE